MSEFGKHIKTRLLSPRLLIYVILAVGSAFLMTKYAPKEAKRQKLENIPYPQEIQYESISCVNDKIPMILVFADSDQADALAPAISQAREFCGVCQVMLITTAHDDLNSADTFGITERPCAILINGENQELGRICGPTISFEDLKNLKDSLEK